MTTAEVQEHVPPPVAPPPAPEPQKAAKPRVGRRAAAEQQQAADESSQEEQLGYFQQQAEIPEVDWERTCQYLYRWQPLYDNTKGGIEPKYVCLYTQSVSIDQIKREHGSGRYNLKLNQRNTNEKSDRTIRQIVFDILDPAFPPNLPDGDWKNDPRNKKWVWGKAEAPMAGPQGGGSVASVLKEVQGVISVMYPDLGKQKSAGVEAELVKILPALLEQRNGQQLDPMALITTIMTLVKTMIPAPVAPPAPDNTMVMFLMKQFELSEARAQKQNELLITLIQQKAEPPKQPDMLETMDRIVGIVGKVGEARDTLGIGGGGASRMNGWQEVLSNVGTEVVKHVGPAIPFLMRQGPRPAAPPQQQPRPIAAPGAAPNPAPAPTAAAAPAPAAAPVSTEDEDNMDAASFLAQQMERLGIIGPLLNYFNDGESGLRFAMWVVDGNGATPLNLIKGQGKAVVMRAITEHLPQLYAQLQPNWGKFDLFVDSFLSWTPDAVLPEDDDDEEDDEDENVPVGASAPPSGTPPAPPPAGPPAPARAAKSAATPKKAAAKKAVKK